MPRESYKTLGQIARENMRQAVEEATARKGQPRPAAQPAAATPGAGRKRIEAVALSDIFADFFDPENLRHMPAFQRGMVLSLVPRYLRSLTGMRDIESRIKDSKIQSADRLLILLKPGNEMLKAELMMQREKLRQRINAKMKTEIITQVIIR